MTEMLTFDTIVERFKHDFTHIMFIYSLPHAVLTNPNESTFDAQVAHTFRLLEEFSIKKKGDAEQSKVKRDYDTLVVGISNNLPHNLTQKQF